MLASLLAVSLALPQQEIAEVFRQPFEVEQPLRIPLTPQMDGRHLAQEWDVLIEGAYLQWEPGILYLASKAPAGSDVIFSLDMNGDGWLQGKDNLEIRCALSGTDVVLTTRLLDATGREGPKWVESPVLEGQLTGAGVLNEESWTNELKLLTLGLPEAKSGAKMGVRVDAIPSGSPDPAAFVPRNTALLSLAYDRSQALPPGMEWNSQYKARSVTPGDKIGIRLNFKNPGAATFSRVDLSTIGYDTVTAASMNLPFPPFDKRGRAFVDYDTSIPAGASLGWRILEGKLTNADETTSTVQTSYHVAPTVVYDVNLPQNLTYTEDSQLVKGSVYIRSQIGKRIDGTFTLVVPEGWSVANGADKKYTIYFSRGSARIFLELITPRGAKGLYPLIFKSTIGESVVETTYMFPIR